MRLARSVLRDAAVFFGNASHDVETEARSTAAADAAKTLKQRRTAFGWYAKTVIDDVDAHAVAFLQRAHADVTVLRRGVNSVGRKFDNGATKVVGVHGNLERAR